MSVFLLILSVVVIAIAVFISYSGYGRAKRYEDESSSLKSKNNELQERVELLQKENGNLSGILSARDSVEKKLEEERKLQRDNDIRSLKEQYDKSLALMKETFRNLTDENSSLFRTKSSDALKDILKPIQDKFAEFDKSVKDSQKDSIDRHSRLEQKIKDLSEKSVSVGNEAKNLANALTGYSKIQGDFGEMLLTDVLKNAGLTEGIHFRTQSVMTDANGHEVRSDSGKVMIPDVMVLYPDDTIVIIDSKVSLTAYSEYMNAESVEERGRLAKAHAGSVRKHVDELKNKDYASYLAPGERKVNYNIMFVPIEGAFRLMLEEDPRLWQVAKDNNVLIVSQMTLMIVLNMIQMSWRQYDQEQNISQVYKTASELMSQLRNWLDAYVKVGAGLESVRKVYDDSVAKLGGSSQSALKKGDTMLGRIRKLERLGLAPKPSRGSIKTAGRLSGPESVIPGKLEGREMDEEENLD
ncbi:MAG: DNA recombination protein RmuC [Bacteroidales bacterium]|jgi:DNA recombination protein RmuC|nr:DNA recombination protein RmuC [Bacteroidales bacterium]